MMQFIDLAAQQKRIRRELESAIGAVLDHGQYIMGPEIGLLEQQLAAFAGVRHAVSCGSGTDALLMALMANAVGPGDVIFTTPFTFISTAEVIALIGATPCFVDIDPETFNIKADHLKKAIDAVRRQDPSIYPLPPGLVGHPARPKGVITVDLFGICADYDAIASIAAHHGLFVIEDAAQSFGAFYKGRRAGALGDVGCTSFFPAKPLGGYGDGGMCFTDDPDVAGALRSIRIHGEGKDKYNNIRIGINGRMDTFQAAVLLEKLKLFPEEITLRQSVADRYAALLNGKDRLQLPVIPNGQTSVWAQYSILAQDGAHRSEILKRLAAHGIPTAIYYVKPLHRQHAFLYLGYPGAAFPVSNDCAERIFSLPMHPYLSEAQQARIAELI
jgi:dTDP-4-amino-4,6-dideoxygalactose transaminase